MQITLRPHRSQVLVDGRDISWAVVAVDVHGEPRTQPVVLLHLRPDFLDLDVEAQAEVSPGLAVTLAALGWTPPGPDAGQSGPAG